MNFLKKTPALALISGLILLCGCSPSEKPPESLDFFAMDTVMNITASADREVLSACSERVYEIENTLSATIDTSEISRLNRDGVLENAGDTTVDIVSRGISYGEQLEGAFDISIRPVSVLWNIKGENPRVPSDDEIEAARGLVDYRNIKLGDKSVTLLKEGMGIDLGGIAKGYAADEIMRILKENGVTSGVFSLGGNVGLCGMKPDGADWAVGIRDPNGSPGEYMALMRLKDTFAVTSGGYERFFEQDGVRYHHIFDPATGRPAEVSLISVTIVSDDSTRADALSTALYVMDFDRALEFYLQNSDFEMVLINSEGGVYVSPGLRDKFTLIDQVNYHPVF